MKKGIFTLTALAIVVSLNSQADYMIKIPLDSPIKFSNWQEHDSIYGEWTNNNGLYGCSNWTPSPDEVTINLEYTQTATDCSQDQTRTVQDQTIDTVSNQVVNDGEQYTESRTITVSETRQAIGTMETWVETIPDYTDWTNVNAVYGCTNWSPATSNYNVGVQFTQTATDCKQDQERTKQDREQETTTLAIRNLGSAITENQTITTSLTRTATGTRIAKVCEYQESPKSSSKYIWHREYTKLTIVWNGAVLNPKSQAYNVTKSGLSSFSVNLNGYKYTVGTYVKDDWYYDSIMDADYHDEYYRVCREPI